jgi:hypothetical protein
MPPLDLAAAPPGSDDAEKALLDAKNEVTAQVTAIEQKLNGIRPMLATLKSTPSVKLRFNKLVDNTDEEKGKIDTSTTQELNDIEPFLKNLDKNVDNLIIDINAAAATEAAAAADKAIADEKIKSDLDKIKALGWEVTYIPLTKTYLYTNPFDKSKNSTQTIPPTENAKDVWEKKSKPLLGILDLGGDDESPPTSPKLKPKLKLGDSDDDDDDDDDDVPLPSTSTTSKWADMFGSPDTTTKLGFDELGGGKKQKRSTKKKQNNNKNNIKKKRGSIKKNKKRIITRNTRRRIFE